MLIVTSVHLVGGILHEHIDSVKWRNTSTNKTGDSTREAMVDYIEKGNAAHVSTSAGTAPIKVVNASPKYIRTYADGKWGTTFWHYQNINQ